MKKCKVIACVVLTVLMLVPMFTMGVGASSAYQTYTYDINGEALYSPDAYTALKMVDSDTMGLEVALDNPNDMVVDEAGNIYIADTGNNRIVILDAHYHLKSIISEFTNEQGVVDSLSSPQGVFVSEANAKRNKTIWVCDTASSRIVVFNADGSFQRIIEEPESKLFNDDSAYKPVAMAVDEYNRLYVVSSTTYQGIIVMTDQGEFTGFIGAQAVSLSAWEILWRRFQTAEQRESTTDNISAEFNNIALGPENCIYVTTSNIDDSDVAGAIASKDGTYSPVKLLNGAGDEIMRRNGFWAPLGEIDYSDKKTDAITGVSTIIDVTMGPEGTWSLIDEKRSRVYTYDENGNLLFAFGDVGAQMGNIASIEAVVYQGTNMLLLDKANRNITVFQRTEYGDLLLQAIEAENDNQFQKAVSLWTEVLKRNANFDTAYVGIGRALHDSGDYEHALAYFESAYDTSNWSNSYKEFRKDWMSNYFLLFLLIIAVAIAGVSLLFKTMGKINKKAATSGKKRNFGHEIAYGFHLIFHPFDGFWDLKHEKRGSVRGAIFYIVIAIFTFYYQAIGQGPLFSMNAQYSSIMTQALGVLVPLFLFVIANWCLTTLFDGEGNFKDVFIATSYSLVPIPLLVIPATIYSNFCIETEMDIISFVGTLAFLWLGMLVFFGTMVTHDYSMGKNVITVLGTVVGMVFIMFVAVLFTTLMGKIAGLVSNVVTEIQFRM